MNRRKVKKRRTNPRILILVEGETERNYFLAIKQDPDYKKSLAALTVEVKKSGKQASLEMVRQAIKMYEESVKENNSYSSVWLVFDHDNNPKRKETWKAAKNSSPELNIAFSTIAFEQWYLLHFKKSAKAYPNAYSLLKALKDYLPAYQKARQNDFSTLKPYLSNALEHAKWLRTQQEKNGKHLVDQNPWTHVDVLVSYLLSLQKS